jgi:hypothetical protein
MLAGRGWPGRISSFNMLARRLLPDPPPADDSEPSGPAEPQPDDQALRAEPSPGPPKARG